MNPDPQESVRAAMVELRGTAVRMNRIGIRVALLTAMSFALMISGLLTRRLVSWQYEPEQVLLPLLAFQGICLGLSAYLLLHYDRLKKEGDLLLEMLSQRLAKSETQTEDAFFAMKLDLTRYSVMASLPFMPGKGGAVAYLLIGCVMLFLSVTSFFV